MPPLHAPAQIRAQLEADRAWSIYALGDLAPGFFEHTAWHAAEGGGALLMLYGAFETPVLFTIGALAGIEPLLDEIRPLRQCYLSIRPEILPLVRARWQISSETPMWRMVLDPARAYPPPSMAARLTLDDYSALTRLYADGQSASDAPDFFAPYMVEQGVFYGVYAGNDLVAAAGTHVVAPGEAVAAIGNVYTRRDHRGHGLATQVTGAVVDELTRWMPRGSIIGLNVKQSNAAALRVYERLGFRHYCDFYEGLTQ